MCDVVPLKASKSTIEAAVDLDVTLGHGGGLVDGSVRRGVENNRLWAEHSRMAVVKQQRSWTALGSGWSLTKLRLLRARFWPHGLPSHVLHGGI